MKLKNFSGILVVFILTWFAVIPGASAVVLIKTPLAIVNTITVNSTSDLLASGDGKCTLREAVINANNNAATYSDCASGSSSKRNKIVLPAGTYCLSLAGTSDEEKSATGDLDILGNLTVAGAGSGTTIIDGGGASGSSARGCTTVSNEGLFDLAASSLSVTIQDVTLTGGAAAVAGGAIYVGSNALTLTKSVLSENSAPSYGGALYANTGTVTISDSTLTDNKSDSYGGAIHTMDSTFTISGTTFSGNKAPNSGGAVFIWGGALTVSTSSFSNNEVSSAYGGAVSAFNSALSLSYVTVSGNHSASNGGGVYATGETVTVANSTFSGNSTDADGGALFAIDASVSANNSTFSGNTAVGKGGALYVQDSSGLMNVVLASATIYDNDSAQGGGIYINSTATRIYDTILTGNSATTSGPNCYGSFTAGSRNIIQDNSACTTTSLSLTTTSDPLLSALASNGGTTQTHALSAGSSALNAGKCDINRDGAIDYATDQRGTGYARVSGSACDIGAYEK